MGDMYNVQGAQALFGSVRKGAQKAVQSLIILLCFSSMHYPISGVLYCNLVVYNSTLRKATSSVNLLDLPQFIQFHLGRNRVFEGSFFLEIPPSYIKTKL